MCLFYFMPTIFLVLILIEVEMIPQLLTVYMSHTHTYIYRAEDYIGGPRPIAI
jgi:hypothetical protein